MIASDAAIVTDPPDWRSYFAGDWRLSRRIADRRGARVGTASGVAQFAAADANSRKTLFCAETLVIDYGGHRLDGEQKTIWSFVDSQGPDLHFHDGRDFCAMRFRRDVAGWRASFAHACGDDRYAGEACIADRDNWRLVWTVNGPRKDYTLDTAYVRLEDSRQSRRLASDGAARHSARTQAGIDAHDRANED